MTSIIIPYRDRKRHLDLIVPHLRRWIKNDFEILVIEQSNQHPFNRGKLLNIGFLNRSETSTHIVTHDVDMLAQKNGCRTCGKQSHNGVDYSFKKGAVHLAGKASQFNGRMPYPTYFGGVTSFDIETFKAINGYSNDFWGWGAEDDDIYNRVIKAGIKPGFLAYTFTSLFHKKQDFSNHKRNLSLLHAGNQSGLSNCDYQILSTEEYRGAKVLKIDFEYNP